MAVVLATGCSSDRAPAAQDALEPPVGLETSLQDEITPLRGDRIAWSTFWRLCWSPDRGVKAYELRPLTGEGDPGTLRRQSGRCFRIQAAAGVNPRSRGLVLREEQLALQQGQLAYQVRAVLEDRRVTPWSAAVAVGERRTQASE